MEKKITKEKAIKMVMDEHFKSLDFPAAGVRKQLRVLSDGIKNNNYSKIRDDQVKLLQRHIEEDREFFPYPLFSYY